MKSIHEHGLNLVTVQSRAVAQHLMMRLNGYYPYLRFTITNAPLGQFDIELDLQSPQFETMERKAREALLTAIRTTAQSIYHGSAATDAVVH